MPWWNPRLKGAALQGAYQISWGVSLGLLFLGTPLLSAEYVRYQQRIRKVERAADRDKFHRAVQDGIVQNMQRRIDARKEEKKKE